ncbi:hypothetical protein GCM10007079_42480 [Nocardiopsis terrae]|uniref:DUF695 domain-containing protein n=1 Tax=Nocardiopsis terrae TaxID=372655 RepID=A0ABR9HLR2_9ACTN|nr:DUF695 domain-containing protein [Nocardiopsis terrae]MBE1459935.1 hypothetical protein [Nocardiopsis terrae]GHC93260.1 hypothetical protein GCM10007079_42480 [Nocardiopsis terrae]
MALFRRRRSAGSSDSAESTAAVTAFWDAWPTVRSALADSVESGTPAPAEVSERVTALVREIHPDLDWEVGQAPRPQGGLDELDLSPDVDPAKLLEQLAALDDPSGLTEAPAYAMTLRPGPSEEARIQSERWFRSAPEDTEWRFLPVRPADHEQLGNTVSWDDHELDLSHVSVSMRVNQGAGKIEVGVYHPDNMFLSGEARQGVADHVTMLALGEDEVVRWVGKVESLDERPLDPLPPTSMPAVAKQMGDLLGGTDGWVTLHGRLPLQGPVEILLRHPVTRRDLPALSLFVQVLVPYADADADRLPEETSVAALSDLEARLAGILGENGALFMQQTAGGQRMYVYYLDPDSGVLPEFENELMDWPEGKVQLRTQMDPKWQQFNLARRPYVRKLGL